MITDPDFGISASVLDKGASKQRYAVRQITRAREEAENPWLRKMNEKHAVIESPKTKVARWVRSEIDPDRKVIVLQSFDDIRNSYCDRRVQIGIDAQKDPKWMKLGRWWLEHKNRRKFEELRFRPDLDQEVVEGNCLNLWTGFGVDLKPGDWSLMHRLVDEALAGGDAE